MDDLLREFLAETTESLDAIDFDLTRLEKSPDNEQILDNIFRRIHTLKGTCGFLYLPRLSAIAHAAETLLDQFRNGLPVTAKAVTLMLAASDRIKSLLAELECRRTEPPGQDLDLIDELARMAQSPFSCVAANGRVVNKQTALGGDDRTFSFTGQSIPIAVVTLKNLMEFASELVLARNQLIGRLRCRGDSEINASLQHFSDVTTKLHDTVTKTWMRPIGSAWRKLPGLVRDLARQLGKEIELETSGADTELDLQALEAIKEPITHMVRNSADHGLEPPQERRELGKPEKGTIRLSAHREGGEIIIAVADDGRGLDTAKIRAQAIARGLASEAELVNLSEVQIHDFIFAPGFSTAVSVTSISGRGVGMDVVHNNVAAVRGAIVVTSQPGKGTTIVLTVPLAIAAPVVAARAA